jgi:putative transcriptional regulator
MRIAGAASCAAEASRMLCPPSWRIRSSPSRVLSDRPVRRARVPSLCDACLLKAYARGLKVLLQVHVVGWPVVMRRRLTGLIACIVLGGAAAASQGRVAELKRGMLLYAMPGLPDPNFANTVVLLLEHNSDGSLGVVLNRPTLRSVDEALDVKAGTSGIDLHVFWGGPVQPAALLSLVQTARPGPRARTILSDVHLTPDLAEVQQVLGERAGRLRVRIFSGYAGWGRGQLAAEVRAGNWVPEPADAATVFSTDPSEMWEKVREILRRLYA